MFEILGVGHRLIPSFSYPVGFGVSRGRRWGRGDPGTAEESEPEGAEHRQQQQPTGLTYGKGGAYRRQGLIAFQGEFEYIAHFVDKVKLNFLVGLFRKVDDIFFVPLGQNNLFDAGAMGGQDLFLDPADR